MTTAPLQLHHTKHPHKNHRLLFDQLIALESNKERLLGTMQLLLNRDGYAKWKSKHHPKGTLFIDKGTELSPLIILYGDVGCGKTELAQSVGTPLGELIGGKTIHCFETPSDIRGGGHVGELSARITAAFEQARTRLPHKESGILIIDEADDLATSRSQNQAHHEDRAGVNVLIKEIERLAKERINLITILITNRFDSLDPAVVRRSSLNLEFNRPNPELLQPLFKYLLDGTDTTDEQYKKLITACKKKKPLFNFSDIRKRVASQAIIKAIQDDVPLSMDIFLEIIEKTNPSPRSK